MINAICPCCGQLVVPADQPRLPKIKARILNAVRNRPGIGAEALRCAVWQHDPGGGPECRHAIYVHIHQLNKLIAAHGILVRAQKGGTGGYRIQRVQR
jgi:hypothetical protein